MSAEIFKGSILEVKADAIVNPANSFMQHSGGLAAVIHACASGDTSNGYVCEDWSDIRDMHVYHDAYIPALQAYFKHKDEAGLIPTGGAICGPPGALSRRFKAIIHAVGPVWGGGSYLERNLLARAYGEVACITENKGFESVAAPAISAGVFGMPIADVAREAVMVAKTFSVQMIFALMDDAHVEAFEREINR